MRRKRWNGHIFKIGEILTLTGMLKLATLEYPPLPVQRLGMRPTDAALDEILVRTRNETKV